MPVRHRQRSVTSVRSPTAARWTVSIGHELVRAWRTCRTVRSSWPANRSTIRVWEGQTFEWPLRRAARARESGRCREWSCKLENRMQFVRPMQSGLVDEVGNLMKLKETRWWSLMTKEVWSRLNQESLAAPPSRLPLVTKLCLSNHFHQFTLLPISKSPSLPKETRLIQLYNPFIVTGLTFLRNTHRSSCSVGSSRSDRNSLVRRGNLI